MRRLRRPSPATVLAFIALSVALGGTALAATGQLVNLADGTNAANLAKVDASGAVRTASAGPPVPAKGFVMSHQAHSYSSDGYTFPFGTPSTATLALTNVNLARPADSSASHDVALYYLTVPAGQTCSKSSPFYDVRILGTYTLTAGAPTVSDDRATPLVLKPTAGRSWCLLTYNSASPVSDLSSINVVLSGFVVAGTPPAGTARRSTTQGARGTELDLRP